MATAIFISAYSKGFRWLKTLTSTEKGMNNNYGTMDIIKRNFLKLMCSGALHEYDQIEPMSNFKWRKLMKMAVAQKVMTTISAGIKSNPSVPQAMNQEIFDEILAFCPNNQPATEHEAQLYNPIFKKRLQIIRNTEPQSKDASIETLQLLNLIVFNTSEVLSYGFSYNNLLPIGIFLRERGDRVDFIKLEKWLGKLHLKHFAQFFGSILITTLNFDQEEIPFVQTIDKNAYNVAIKAMSCSKVMQKSNWQFHQTSAGFVENDSKAMMRVMNNCLHFFNYAPIETISNFTHSFVKNLSELEE